MSLRQMVILVLGATVFGTVLEWHAGFDGIIPQFAVIALACGWMCFVIAYACRLGTRPRPPRTLHRAVAPRRPQA